MTNPGPGSLLNQRTISRREELIYGRRHGMALTLEVFSPTVEKNGVGIVLFLSEGWYSEHCMIESAIEGYIEPLLVEGFTVFAVIHGSSPKFNVVESIEDARRAVRFVRHHSSRYGVYAERLGAVGDSAGGHLSLMVGCEQVDSSASEVMDAVDREPSCVKAVVAFFPPTDFLNWGTAGSPMLGQHPLVPLEAAFSFSHFEKSRNVFVPITDEAIRLQIARSISPITHVHPMAAASLIVVGDADEYIPPQQSLSLVDQMKRVGMVHELIVNSGGGHDAETIKAHMPDALAWFKTNLVNCLDFDSTVREK